MPLVYGPSGIGMVDKGDGVNCVSAFLTEKYYKRNLSSFYFQRVFVTIQVKSLTKCDRRKRFLINYFLTLNFDRHSRLNIILFIYIKKIKKKK